MTSTAWTKSSVNSTGYTKSTVNSTGFTQTTVNSTSFEPDSIFSDSAILYQDGSDTFLYQDSSTFPYQI